MCGIAGIMRSNGTRAEQPYNDEMLRAMAEAMLHRGPDGTRFWHDQHIELAFCRLAIVDIMNGQQPLANEDGTIQLVFNGEIYNYRALRSQLQEHGHHFTTNSDSEVIVHLYEQYGMGFIQQLRGMFAFALWDSKQQLLFCARDPFGIKPFYYAAEQNGLLFASEIKSIVAARTEPPSFYAESLYNYLTFQYVPEPLTMFEGIYKLPPAHMLIARLDGDIRIERYWKPEFHYESSSIRTVNDWAEQIREVLTQTVVRHISDEVEAGCFLSSGIDSTAIAALMQSSNSPRSLKTFSVGFAGANNETIIADLTASVLGTDHRSLIISEQDYFSAIPQAVWHQDEPLADPSAVALFHLAQLASDSVKVVLSGEGADELFGGYRIYREPAAVAPIAALPQPLRSIIHAAAKRLPPGLKGRGYLLRGSTPLEQRFFGNACIFSNDMKLELLKADYLPLPIEGRSTPELITAALYKQTEHLDPVSRMQHIDLSLWLPGNILMKADKMSMAHSLELRVPFLDLELFQLASSLPPELKIAQGTTKYILRKALQEIVPPFIAYRPKLGFPVPLRQWLSSSRGDGMLEHILSSPISHYFNVDYIIAMHKRHKAGEGDYARKLYTLYILAVWHDAFISSTSLIRRPFNRILI